MEEKENKGFAPFYAGQKVVAIDAVPGSFINGQNYIVSSCEYKMNKVNGLWFWYVGIVGYHDWLSPSIFAPFNDEFIKISLSNILEKETKIISVN